MIGCEHRFTTVPLWGREQYLPCDHDCGVTAVIVVPDYEEPTEPRVIPSRTSDPVTSHKAAAAVTVKANTQRGYLLQSFASAWLLGHFGGALTDEEAMESNMLVSPRSEFSKRCSELREAGLIEPTGETRTGASGHQRIVSRITEAGRKVVASL